MGNPPHPPTEWPFGQPVQRVEKGLFIKLIVLCAVGGGAMPAAGLVLGGSSDSCQSSLSGMLWGLVCRLRQPCSGSSCCTKLRRPCKTAIPERHLEGRLVQTKNL